LVKKTNILAVIPARSNSKEIPNKNIEKIFSSIKSIDKKKMKNLYHSSKEYKSWKNPRNWK